MIRTCMAFALVPLLITPGQCQEFEDVTPPTSPIIFGVAKVLDDESVEIRYDALAPNIPVTEEVTQNYTVMIPYKEEVEKDGETIEVEKMRPETRTRVVNVTRMHKVANTRYKLSECKFQDMAGTELPQMATLEKMKQGQPVVTIRPGAELNDYYKALLREDVIVVVCPEPKIESKK